MPRSNQRRPPLRALKQKRASAHRGRRVYSKDSTMSTAPLRQELEDLIRRHLLGPAGGEQETITEQSVRNRYLLGMLAPLKVIEVDEEPFDELADGSEDNAEEGTAEPSTPAKRGVAPSTFGLSFCLNLAETAFESDARWGQYLRESDADGKTVWKRYPRGSNQTIPLKEGNLRSEEHTSELQSRQYLVCRL